MLALQKPMLRGRYALMALAHILLIGVLLWVMAWGESLSCAMPMAWDECGGCAVSFGSPLGACASALSCLAGMVILCSLVALTMRRMRDACIPGILLFAPFVCVATVLLIAVVRMWLMSATPMDGTLPTIGYPAVIAVFYGAGILFLPLVLIPFFASSQRPSRKIFLYSSNS